ncbi:MAG: hypothetical protein NXI16_13680 [Alphaproteobacteria bacterium]|nr:hypothetical protein [Alphaproteobacteria bacterium]
MKGVPFWGLVLWAAAAALPAKAQDLDQLFRNDLPTAPPGATLDDNKSSKPAELPAAPANLRQVTVADCQSLQASKRFIERVAKSPSKMPIRLLSGFVLTKPLAEYGPDDFADLERVESACRVLGAGPQLLITFEDKVVEAQDARLEALDWVKRTLATVESLEPGREAIVYLNSAWNDMLTREPLLMNSDMRVVSSAIILKQEQIYRQMSVPRSGSGSDGGRLPIGNRTLPHGAGD